MAVCPQCNQRVPLKELLAGAGWAGVVCPSCHTSLWPKRWSSFLLIFLSLGLGQIAYRGLKAQGVGEPWLILTLLGVIALAFLILAGLIIRLAPKGDIGRSLQTR